MHRSRTWIALSLTLAACGNGTSTDATAPDPNGEQVAVSVSIAPTSATLATGETLQFTVTVSGTLNAEVRWDLVEGAAAGALTATGLYTAPATAGTYHVKATSVADPTSSGEAAVQVTILDPGAQGVIVSINPTTLALTAGASKRFTALVTGASDTSVVWEVVEGATGGSVDALGNYTAPSITGTYHLKVTSQADGTRSATAIIEVVDILVYPLAATMKIGAKQTFTVFPGQEVTNLDWVVFEGVAGGTIAADGTYTAPQTPGTYHVTATLKSAPAKTVTVPVQIVAGDAVSVTITPAISILSPSQSFVLSADTFGTLSGASLTPASVSWLVADSSTGALTSISTTPWSYTATAPVTPAIIYIEAVSDADATKSAFSTLIVK